MPRHTHGAPADWTDDPAEAPAYGTRRKARPPQRARPAPSKQSYESSAEVQRWLSGQQPDEVRKPPFAPSLIAGRRDALWILSSLGDFYEQDLIVDVVQEVKSGKEASVFSCLADPRLGGGLLAAKIYRPRMFRSLSNDAIYRDGRALRDESGQVVRDRRRVPGGLRGRLLQVDGWISYEQSAHERAYAAGASAPRPIARVGNGILMEYLGDEAGPAPRLCDVAPSPGEARDWLAAIIDDIRRCLAAGVIHGDLSGYNLLVWQGRPWLIDFAQAVDPQQSADARALLARDVARVVAGLRRFGAQADAAALADRIWREHDPLALGG